MGAGWNRGWVGLVAGASAAAWLAPAAAAADPPWKPRLRRATLELQRTDRPLRDLRRWPDEPQAPDPVDAEAFRRAVVDLCPKLAAHKASLLADEIREAAAAEGVDPFLLGGLVHAASGCNRLLETPFGAGLLQIQPAMVRRSIRGGALVYLAPAPGTGSPELVPRARSLPPDPFLPKNLVRRAHNLRVGAALLGMWQEQHAIADRHWRGARHRTAAAHFFWGDRVRGASCEDRTLIARRRLIERYAGAAPASIISTLGIPLTSPLDGTPRLAWSGPGEDRDGGARTHRGLDIEAAEGEPVRAVAAGIVSFAGADRPGLTAPEVMRPRAATRAGDDLGPGGLFVCIRHGDGFSSCYFHLSSYRVGVRDHVMAGEVIGRVGRTGVKRSETHLHFEVHANGYAINPAPVLGALVIPPQATVNHRMAMARRKMRLSAGRSPAPMATRSIR